MIALLQVRLHQASAAGIEFVSSLNMCRREVRLQKKRDFETSQTVSIDDIETFFSQLDNFGVPDGASPPVP